MTLVERYCSLFFCFFIFALFGNIADSIILSLISKIYILAGFYKISAGENCWGFYQIIEILRGNKLSPSRTFSTIFFVFSRLWFLSFFDKSNNITLPFLYPLSLKVAFYRSCPSLSSSSSMKSMSFSVWAWLEMMDLKKLGSSPRGW